MKSRQREPCCRDPEAVEADGRKHRRCAVQSQEGEEAERREEAPWGPW